MAKLKIEFYAKSLARRTTFDLVIPSLNLHGCLNNKDEYYYENLEEKYPLVIFLHGFGENGSAWQNNTQIIKLCEDNKIAGCFINGDNKWYLNMGPIDDYYSLIERDILDYLYGNFRCLSRSKPLGIAGVSMGGYGALYHYLKNIDKYQACIALSPATKPDEFDEKKYGSLRDLFLDAKNKPLNIYLSVGTKDFIYNASKELDSFLKENEINARYKMIDGSDHSWVTWNKEIFSVLSFLKDLDF